MNNIVYLKHRILSPIRSIIIDLIKRNRLNQYFRSGKIPWFKGYSEYRTDYIKKVLYDDTLMSHFRKGVPLPLHYGVGLDERCIEYPWLLSHISDKNEMFLDAGSALNHEYILAHPVFQHKKMHILTLAPEVNCYWHKGLSYLFHDLRSIPIKDSYYDTIACISTLEHIGCDNRYYTHDSVQIDNAEKDFQIALRELYRVMKPKGVLYLTVPFGVYKHYGAFQQFDENLLSIALETFGNVGSVSVQFYRYSADGWDLSSLADCAACQFVDWIILPREQWPSPLRAEHDPAAAARAVACIELVKA